MAGGFFWARVPHLKYEAARALQPAKRTPITSAPTNDHMAHFNALYRYFCGCTQMTRRFPRERPEMELHTTVLAQLFLANTAKFYHYYLRGAQLALWLHLPILH